MPFQIDEVSNGVFFARLFGEGSAEDLRGLREATRAHPDYDPKFKGLVDCRDLEFSHPSISPPAAGRGRAQFPVISKGVFLIDRKDFGLMRMYRGWAGGDEQMLITSDFNEAREWLGLPEN